MRLALTALLAASALGGATVCRADSAPKALPNCQGAPQSMPTQVVFACGDGNVYAHNLMWTSWGQYYAYAKGTLTENDCTPNCAAGHFHSFHASLTVWGKQRCPNGEFAYEKAAYTITDPALPSSGQAQYIGAFPCKPM